MHGRRLLLQWLLAVSLTAVVLGCGRQEGAAPAAATHATHGLTLVSFAVEDTTYREGKRAPDLEGAMHALAVTRPDLLAVQYNVPGILPGAFASSIRRVLPGLTHVEIVTGSQGGAALLLLSRFPVVTRRSDSDLSYRMGDQQHRLDPGMLDVDIVAQPHGLIRVVVARLKDKVFHVSGQTEMRRNEARMLARRLRREPQDGYLVVAATLNDTADSAPVREFTEHDDVPLTALRPVDGRGDSWTWRDPAQDRYERSDYVLVSTNLSTSSAELLDAEALRTVSSHRAIVVRFRGAQDSAR